MFAAVHDVRDPSDALRRQFSANRPSIRRTESRDRVIRSESVSRGQIQLPGVTGKPGNSRYDKRLVAADVVQVAERDREVDLFLLLRGTRQSRNTRRHVDGVAAA